MCVLAERLLTLALFDCPGFEVRIWPPDFVDRSVELSARLSMSRCPRWAFLSLSILPEALPTARFPACVWEPSGPTLEVCTRFLSMSLAGLLDLPTADAMMSEEMPTADSMMEAPAWYSASLADASTGKSFEINDFKGKVVLVETMAIWCSNCNKQQVQVKALHDLLGERDDFVSIGLDIDMNENAADLKKYVESNGFNWLYAVATTEVAQDISKNYGDQFLNPPSTPMLVIDRHGEAHPLPFGIKSADELLKFIQPFLDGTM